MGVSAEAGVAHHHPVVIRVEGGNPGNELQMSAYWQGHNSAQSFSSPSRLLQIFEKIYAQITIIRAPDKSAKVPIPPASGDEIVATGGSGFLSPCHNM